MIRTGFFGGAAALALAAMPVQALAGGPAVGVSIDPAAYKDAQAKGSPTLTVLPSGAKVGATAVTGVPPITLPSGAKVGATAETGVPPITLPSGAKVGAT